MDKDLQGKYKQDSKGCDSDRIQAQNRRHKQKIQRYKMALEHKHMKKYPTLLIK